MENYWLKRYIETSTQRLAFNLARIKILEPLIRETAYFVVDLERIRQTPSWFQEEEILAECLEGTYDHDKAKSWIYLDLYGHAMRQANTIGLLIEQSCTQEGLQQWRSLFEAYVICEFLAPLSKRGPQILHDYIVHGLLSSSQRYTAEYNELCRRRGRKPRYEQSAVDSVECTLKDRFGAKQGDYLWAKSELGDRPTFKKMAHSVDPDMAVFYHFSSKEIHPSIGHRIALAGLALPLPAIPMLPINDVFSLNEIFLDSLTAKHLVAMTDRASDFLTLDRALAERLDSLRLLGKDVLRDLSLV